MVMVDRYWSHSTALVYRRRACRGRTWAGLDIKLKSVIACLGFADQLFGGALGVPMARIRPWPSLVCSLLAVVCGPLLTADRCVSGAVCHRRWMHNDDRVGFAIKFDSALIRPDSGRSSSAASGSSANGPIWIHRHDPPRHGSHGRIHYMCAGRRSEKRSAHRLCPDMSAVTKAASAASV